MNLSLLEINNLLEKAVNAVIQGKNDKPDSESVVNALLSAEKQAKQHKQPISFEQLVGKWRLCFITGTKKAQNRSGVLLGKGRYLSQWVSIDLTYLHQSLIESIETVSEREYGQMINQVQIAALTFTLTGAAQLFNDKRLLAFDFTRLKVSIGNLTLYEGSIRGGKESEKAFYGNSIKNQAFFAFFSVQDNFIAARGKGGGLALWGYRCLPQHHK